MDENYARKIKREMGLTTGGKNSPMGGLGDEAMVELYKNAADATYNKKRDYSKAGKSHRKRGGQPGNQNARKSGVYSSNIKQFEKHFSGYTRALGKASAEEEVALTRAMIINVLNGKNPLGTGVLDDPDFAAEYIRDLFALNLKAQDLWGKQDKQRLDREMADANGKGITIEMSAEMGKAMEAMTAAQEPQQTTDAEELLAAMKQKAAENRPPEEDPADA